MYILIVTISLIAGAALFMLASRLLPDMLLRYRKYFTHQVDQGLKHVFLFSNIELLFIVHIILTITLVVGGNILLGYTGIIIGTLISVAAPAIWLSLLRKRRKQNFIVQLPDVLTSISTSLKAGSNLSKAFELVSRQQPNPAAQEFMLIISEYKMGKPIDLSLKDMALRMSCYEVDLMVSAISISRGVGGDLATTLDNLSVTVQTKIHMEEKISALTAMGRMQGWVVGFIPIAVLLVMNIQEPEGMSAMFNEPVGLTVLAVITAMTLLAAFMIYRIVNIDI